MRYRLEPRGLRAAMDEKRGAENPSYALLLSMKRNKCLPRRMNPIKAIVDQVIEDEWRIENRE
jgi:hypothetical protein